MNIHILFAAFPFFSFYSLPRSLNEITLVIYIVNYVLSSEVLAICQRFSSIISTCQLCLYHEKRTSLPLFFFDFLKPLLLGNRKRFPLHKEHIRITCPLSRRFRYSRRFSRYSPFRLPFTFIADVPIHIHRGQTLQLFRKMIALVYFGHAIFSYSASLGIVIYTMQ